MSDVSSEERVYSDCHNGEWYAVRIGQFWSVFDAEGAEMMMLTDRPTPTHLGNMEVAYGIGWRAGRISGEDAARADIRRALGIPA